MNPDVALGPLRHTSSSGLVTDALRRLILLGALGPGERLPSERQLAETLRVGRDSIRSALRTMAGEGLVVTRRGRHGGTFVTDDPVRGRLTAELLASHREITATYEFRRTIEPVAASLAAQRADLRQVQTIAAIAEENAWSVRSFRAIDSRFHAAIAEASGNTLFVDAVQHTRVGFFAWYDELYSRVDWSTLPVEDRDFGYVHRPIAAAIEARDSQLAGNLVRAHLEWSERDLIELLDNFVAEAAAGDR